MTDYPRAVPLEDRWDVTVRAAPPDFPFPPKFREFVSTGLPDLRPLYWLLLRKGQVEFWTETLAEQFPDRVLIPFAKTDGNDDIHCFDGTDTSGNPPVLLIHAFTTPCWEYRGEWYHFDSWLKGAVEFHEEQMEADEE